MPTNKASFIVISKHFARMICVKTVGFVLREWMTFCSCQHLSVFSTAVMLCSLKLRKFYRWKNSTLHFSLLLLFYFQICIYSSVGLRTASLNPLTPNDLYMGRTAPLTSKRCVLYIYSTNVGTEYLKHALYSPFFPLQNAVCFIMLTSLVPVLFTFYIQYVLKLKKKIIPAPKG